MSRVRGAVIGIGGIGKQHGRMQIDSGRIDLVAVCDANPKAREIAEKEFPGVPFFTAVAEMLAVGRPGLVSIATPHVLHAPQAIECLRGGAMVVVEKPMATRYEDAQAMIACARECGRALTVYHNRRLDPWQVAAKAAVDDGLLGRLFELNIGIGGAYRDATWRADKLASGGVLFDWGAHLVDYAVILAASPVVAVSGWLYRRPGSDPARNEDHGRVAIDFASGARAHITISNLLYDNRQRYQLLGEKGTLTDPWHWHDDGKLTIKTKLSSDDYATIEVAYHPASKVSWYAHVAAHLLDGTPLLVSAESAAQNINILCTAQRSHAQGGIPLPLQ